MTTKEALLVLIEGKKVRIPRWGKTSYLTLSEKGRIVDETNTPHSLPITEYWEIYEEPKTKQVVAIEKWLIYDNLSKSYAIAEESNIDGYISDDRGYLSKVRLLDTKTYEVGL